MQTAKPATRGFAAEWTVTIILLLFGTTTALQAFVIPTGSMESTLLVGEMRTDEHRVEFDALRAEQMQYELVHVLEVLAREALASQAVLIGDHDQTIAGALQSLQCREYAGQQADLVEPIDLLVGRLLDQRAIAVEE